jgi:hypothetical protein
MYELVTKNDANSSHGSKDKNVDVDCMVPVHCVECYSTAVRTYILLFP